jgi:predicted RNA-binding protein with PIN domain
LSQAGSDPGADLAGDDVDRTEAAATAWLLRVPGWRAEGTEVDPGASRSGDRSSSPTSGTAAEARLRELTARVDRVRADADRHRARDRQRVEGLKEENDRLRRTLNQTRTRLSAATAEADALRAEADLRARELEQATGSAEAEVRRLKARVETLEEELTAARKVERSAKVSGSVRARLLLDTLAEAAQGLRRELALPVVDRLPADELAAEPGRAGARVSTGRGSLHRDDPRLLEELLGLPRAHLVVDGYNVTKTTWPDLSLERQRERLLGGVASLAARTGVEATIVFDAGETGDTASRPLVAPPRGVRVRFSPAGVIADDVIRELLHLEPPGRPVVVVTSDRELAGDVERLGFRAVAAATLPRLLTRA